LIVTELALVAFQLKVADWPLVIDAGDAVSVAVGGTGPCAAIVHVRPLIPARVAGEPHEGRGMTELDVV